MFVVRTATSSRLSNWNKLLSDSVKRVRGHCTTSVPSKPWGPHSNLNVPARVNLRHLVSLKFTWRPASVIAEVLLGITLWSLCIVNFAIPPTVSVADDGVITYFSPLSGASTVTGGLAGQVTATTVAT